MPSPLTVLVLTCNGLDFTRVCLRSLAEATVPARVVLVDNQSTDGTPEAVRAEFPQVEVLVAPDNLGYAGGNNLGLRLVFAGGADLCLLLNNDTWLPPHALAGLLEARAERPRAGLLGPMVYTGDAGQRISSAGGQVRWRHADAVNLGMGDLDAGQFPARPVDFVNGCALLVTRPAFEATGGLDDSFFMYWEETDWAWRVRRAGFEVWFDPRAWVRHFAPITHTALGPTTLYYVTRNRLRFMARHAPWPGKPLTLARAYRGAWQGARQHRAAGRLAHARATELALRHFMRGQTGRVDPRLWAV